MVGAGANHSSRTDKNESQRFGRLGRNHGNNEEFEQVTKMESKQISF